MNILVFLMSLLRSKYDSLLTIADGLLLAAVAPSIIVQLVFSIYISPVSFGIFGSFSCVGRFLSVHCDLVASEYLLLISTVIISVIVLSNRGFFLFFHFLQ